MTTHYKISNRKGGTIQKFQRLLPLATPQELIDYAERLLSRVPKEYTWAKGCLTTEYLWKLGAINSSAQRYLHHEKDDARVRSICIAFNFSMDWVRTDYGR